MQTVQLEIDIREQGENWSTEHLGMKTSAYTDKGSELADDKSCQRYTA